MTELRARSAVLHAQPPTRRPSARWWVLGVLVSLLLHGAAAAALLVPWGHGAKVDAGGIVTVEIVALSGPGAQPPGPVAEARPSFDDLARPHPEPVAEARRQTAETPEASAALPSSDRAERPAPKVSSGQRKTADHSAAAQETPPPLPERSPDTPAVDAVEPVENPAATPPPVPAPKPVKTRAEAVRQGQETRETRRGDSTENSEASETTAAGAAEHGRPAPPAPQSASLPNDAGSPAGGGLSQSAQPAGGGGSGAAPLSGNPQPQYPYRARQRHWEGRVVLRVVVDAQGQPERVSVLSSSGYDVLDDAALDAIRRWRFQPARRAGRPVAEEIEIPVRFALKD